MYRNKRPYYSQHFLKSRKLVQKLIRKSSVGLNDRVLEIGPGRGIITRELLDVGAHVLGIEIDPRLCNFLLNRFVHNPNFLLFCGDFLDFPLPYSEYKVFANLPFAIEGEIVRKLLDAKNPPTEMCLVVIKDVGERWVGHHRESLFSVSHKPWFEMKIVHRFIRSDFVPKPKIDSVLIRIKKISHELLPWEKKKNFEKFVREIYGAGRRLDTNLPKILGKDGFGLLRANSKFDFQSKPSDVPVDKWVKWFELIEIDRQATCVLMKQTQTS